MTFVQNLTFFVLAAFVGYEIITKIPTNLHTPLMSGANAISGIALIGALIVSAQAEMASEPVVVILGLLSIIFATINVVGGFMVTDRMLEMFKKK